MEDLVGTSNSEKIKPTNSLKSAETSATVVLGGVRYLHKMRLCRGFRLSLVW